MPTRGAVGGGVQEPRVGSVPLALVLDVRPAAIPACGVATVARLSRSGASYVGAGRPRRRLRVQLLLPAAQGGAPLHGCPPAALLSRG